MYQARSGLPLFSDGLGRGFRQSAEEVGCARQRPANRQPGTSTAPGRAVAGAESTAPWLPNRNRDALRFSARGDPV